MTAVVAWRVAITVGVVLLWAAEFYLYLAFRRSTFDDRDNRGEGPR